MDIDTTAYRIKEHEKVHLEEIDTQYNGKIDKDNGIKEFSKLMEKLTGFQELLYADSSRSLLVILQAMDGAGKDSTIRSVFGPLNPQGVNVASFKAPTASELSHDFLWRIHREAPAKGSISIFNRSQYEDVLVVKVKEFAPPKTIEKRYDHINAFEKLLAAEGTRIIKIFLHISKDYQKKRLQKRLDEPEKQWKFNPGDLKDRALWGEFMNAYEEVLKRCSTDYAPWYVIPAETKWFRNLLIAKIVTDSLADLDLHYPKPGYDPKSIVIE